jgi:hypothetical protein
MWDEPAHWYAGMTPHFRIHDQVTATGQALRTYAGFLGKVLLPLLLILIAIPRRPSSITAPVILVSIAVLVTYGIIHTEPRLAAPWFVIGAIAYIAGVNVPSSSKRRGIAMAGVYLLTAVCVASVVMETQRSINPGNDEGGLSNAVHSQFLVAQKLSASGSSRAREWHWSETSRTSTGRGWPTCRLPIRLPARTRLRTGGYRRMHETRLTKTSRTLALPPLSLRGPPLHHLPQDGVESPTEIISSCRSKAVRRQYLRADSC